MYCLSVKLYIQFGAFSYSTGPHPHRHTSVLVACGLEPALQQQLQLQEILSPWLRPSEEGAGTQLAQRNCPRLFHLFLKRL